jgi:8-oxo-dGTP pyrophosphatase MutT (NUDIX family)
MELFSKLSKAEKNKKEKEYELKYDGYLKVKDADGWEYVEEKDCVVVIPHLVNFDEILLRKEVVPPFSSRFPKQEHFLTVVSGTMDGTETPEETLIRELREETGIKLNTGFEGWKKWGEFFWNKGNNSRCHLYYLPLTITDFSKIQAYGDGSQFEENSSTLRVDIAYLDSLKPSDLITQTMLLYLRKELD